LPPDRPPLKTLVMLRLRNFLVALFRILGSDVHDCETGEKIGRALLLPWRGRILLIGLDANVTLHFLPQKRATFWKQEIGFRKAQPPDFPREPRP
jgi:hypothetical protein